MAKDTHRLIFSALALLFFAACGQEQPVPGPEPEGDVLLHTVWDMNKAERPLNSHAGDELSSALQPMYREFRVIPNTFLLKDLPESAEDQNFACYPRIKRMADGNFIMFYHGGQYGTRVWCTISQDLKSWSTPQLLYTAEKVTIEKPQDDTRRFVNPDAVVLPDGEVLLVVSYRAAGHYGKGLGCGLSFLHSKDNGLSWGRRLDLPVGPNWEPYLLLLPDGTLHCYFTDAIPQTRNSGTGLVISTDGGKTWSSKIRVCQQYKYDYRTPGTEKAQYNGQKIYTDQMPCFRILNDGKTIAGWLEARLEKPVPEDCADSDTYNSYCMMSLVRNHSLEWEDLTSYDVAKPGPADRETNVIKGAAGYVATFPSGEVVLSFGKSSIFRLKLGNSTATSWRGKTWDDEILAPFEGKGYWGSTEVFDNNYMTIAMHSSTEGKVGMQTGVMYLNQRQDAFEENISVDGNAAEWKTDRAFYLCASDGRDAIIRTARDASKLYFAVEARDFEESDIVNIMLKSEGSSSTVTLKVGSNGLAQGSVEGIEATTSPAVSAQGDKGWVCEASVPLTALLVAPGGSLRCYADIYSGGKRHPFTFADVTNSETWQKISLK